MNNGPYIKTKLSYNRMLINLLVAILPIVLFHCGYLYLGHSIDAFKVLIFMGATLITSFITFLILHLLTHIRSKEDFISSLTDSDFIIPSLIISLLIPLTTPLYLLVIGTFGISIIFFLTKRLTYNVNWALVLVLIIVILLSNIILNYIPYSSHDFINMSTLTSIKKMGGAFQPYDNITYIIISSLLYLGSFLYLTLTKTIKWKISVSMLITIVLLSTILGLNSGMDLPLIFYYTLTGGTLFYSIFVSTDSKTSPITPKGMIIYGILIGLMTVILRFYTPITEDILISCLLGNCLVPLLDKIN